MRPAIHVTKESHTCVDVEIGMATSPHAGKRPRKRPIYTTTTLKETFEEEILYTPDLSGEIDGNLPKRQK